MADKKFKQELQKPDDFETFVQNVYEAFRDRKRQVLLGIIVFVVLVGGVVTYQIRQEGVNERAADAFSRMMKTWPVEVQPSVNPEGDASNSQDFPESWKNFDSAASLFLSEHGNSDMAPMAKIYQARAKLGLGEYEKALALYKEVAGSQDKTLDLLALEGEAYALLGMEKWAEAQTVLQRLVDREDNPIRSAHLWYLAQTHDELGNVEKAKEVYQQIGQEAAGTPYAEKAKLRLTVLAESN